MIIRWPPRQGAITTDGSYLYTWDGQAKSLLKIGTGLHGTVAGRVYVKSQKVWSHLHSVYGKPVPEARKQDEQNNPEETKEETHLQDSKEEEPGGFAESKESEPPRVVVRPCSRPQDSINDRGMTP
jgi:hypothetical protein